MLTRFVAEHMELDLDDLDWAKPVLDEARASIARGEGMTLEEHRARIAAKLESLRGR